MVYHLDVSFKEVKFCTKILDILWKENLICGYKKLENDILKVSLRYHDGSPICTRLIILSRPRDRLYLSLIDISRISDEFGILFISTPKGIMTSKEAISKGVAGEILAYAA